MGLSGEPSVRSPAAAESKTSKVQQSQPPVDKKESKFEGAAVSRNREGPSCAKRFGCSVCRTMTTTTTTIGARNDDKLTTPLKPFFTVVKSTHPATSMDNDALFQRWKRRQKSIKDSSIRFVTAYSLTLY